MPHADFDSNVLQRPMGLTTTKKGAQREAFAAAYGTEHEGRDTHSDLMNVKAGITTTKEKAAREAFAAAYGTEHEGKDTHSDLVNVKAGITTTKDKAAREALSAPVSPHLYVVCASPVVLSTQRGRVRHRARGQGYSFRSG